MRTAGPEPGMNSADLDSIQTLAPEERFFDIIASAHHSETAQLANDGANFVQLEQPGAH